LLRLIVANENALTSVGWWWGGLRSERNEASHPPANDR